MQQTEHRHITFPRDPLTMVEAVRYRVTTRPDASAFIFLEDGERESANLTVSELDRRARAIAAFLQAHNLADKRVVLLFAPGTEFVAAFLGCLYAGVVAVPTYPPDPIRLARTLPKFLSVCRDAQPAAILTTEAILPFASTLAGEAPDVAAIPWHPVDTEEIDSLDGDWRETAPSADTLAFLQYTSGSTDRPRGVCVSHGALLANQRMIQLAFNTGDDEVLLSWLPFYHDMGLIGAVMHSQYLGRPLILMPPVAFLKKPLRWLQAISKYGATISGSPNFGFNLCVRKIKPAERDLLDLSNWRAAVNGAEPVRADTIDRFTSYFEAAGFKRKAFYPCYGLAESTLIVTGGRPEQEPSIYHVDSAALEQDRVVEVPADAPGSRVLAGCGQPFAGERLEIVDPETFIACPRGKVGEVWISGSCVSTGYWNLEQENIKTFKAFLAGTGEGPFLRSGDLGFLREDGELFITGRLVDLIIVRGRNHYPQDIERTAEESHPSIRPGCVAAFTIEEEGEDHLIVALEVERRHSGDRRRSAVPTDLRRRRKDDRRQEPLDDGADPLAPAPVNVDEVTASVRQAIAEDHGLNAYHIAVLAAGAIPKTTSGKLQRYLCRRQYLDDSLEKFYED